MLTNKKINLGQERCNALLSNDHIYFNISFLSNLREHSIMLNNGTNLFHIECNSCQWKILTAITQCPRRFIIQTLIIPRHVPLTYNKNMKVQKRGEAKKKKKINNMNEKEEEGQS